MSLGRGTRYQNPTELLPTLSNQSFPDLACNSEGCITAQSSSSRSIANMATSMALGQLVHPLPQATTARFTPSRLCNARVHSQRQLISLRNFTPQQTCRCNQLRSVIQAAMHGDDWTTAPESYLTLVTARASAVVGPWPR